MKESVLEHEKRVDEVVSDEKKYTIDNNDQIKEHNLPGGVSLEAAQRVFNSTICGACEPENKAKLEKIRQLKEGNK